MDDDPQLAQWKAQRDAVARHLAWLDGEIAKRESAVRETSRPQAAATVVSIPPAQEIPPIELPGYDDQQRPQGLTMGNRIGCFLIALAAILLALGLIFVLPQYLYD